MKDYRRPEHRMEYFTELYRLNLCYGIMPGLVYIYLPELARRYGWGPEQRLWFAFLNGLTQNPITSLILFLQLDQVPKPDDRLTGFEVWFNMHWDHLQFDTDRKYQKKDTVAAIKHYAKKVRDHGDQATMLTGKYQDLWSKCSQIMSFGRLSTFSYLEYVKISGYGADCDSLLFESAGSRSHRNGMLLLLGMDNLVWDRRQKNGFKGDYDDIGALAAELEAKAEEFLATFELHHPAAPNVSKFTMESNLCTFKNHFFGHRYPGVYADMAWQRIERAEEKGYKDITAIFRQIREDRLPKWLRTELLPPTATPIPNRGESFRTMGRVYRGRYFLSSLRATA